MPNPQPARCSYCGVRTGVAAHERSCPERVRVERAKRRARELFFGKER